MSLSLTTEAALISEGYQRVSPASKRIQQWVVAGPDGVSRSVLFDTVSGRYRDTPEDMVHAAETLAAIGALAMVMVDIIMQLPVDASVKMALATQVENAVS